MSFSHNLFEWLPTSFQALVLYTLNSLITSNPNRIIDSLFDVTLRIGVFISGYGYFHVKPERFAFSMQLTVKPARFPACSSSTFPENSSFS